MINKQKNNVHAKIAREIINEHDSHLEKAIKWSQYNVKLGSAALRTNNFPLITNTWTINRCYDGLVTKKGEYESRSIFTNHGEQTLVAYLKDMDRCNQGISRLNTMAVIL